MKTPVHGHAGHRIATNIDSVRRHYDKYFSLLDRNKSFEAAGWSERPPIINMGYWAGGARTAREAQETFVRELASRAPALKERHVLDAGCGVGGPATILACEYGAQVDGVNIVEQQVRWAHRFLKENHLEDRVRVHLASAMDLPFADGSFDVVFCLEAAHCFCDKLRFLKESRRVLKPGGMLLLADITANTRVPFVSWQPALKLHLIRAVEWERLLESAGFTIVEERMVGDAVYRGCRWWAHETAGERRRAIFEKSCSRDSSVAVRKAMMMRAWILEFVWCRSVLLTLSRLRLREFVLFVARTN
jgi:cyclopropane fatty-acyl-phospholipid synthase-like methyltransferase